MKVFFHAVAPRNPVSCELSFNLFSFILLLSDYKQVKLGIEQTTAYMHLPSYIQDLTNHKVTM